MYELNTNRTKEVNGGVSWAMPFFRSVGQNIAFSVLYDAAKNSWPEPESVAIRRQKGRPTSRGQMGRNHSNFRWR